MKLGHIEINVRQYGDGRWGFDDYSSGRRRMVRLLTKHKAESRAADVAVCLANGRGDLLEIDPVELRKFREWQAACNASPPLTDARTEFLKLKSKKSSRHFASISGDLQLFEDFIGARRVLGEIKALDIQRFLDSRQVSERRQFNLRASIVTLFRWAKRMSYLDPERMTEAEKVEPIQYARAKVNVLSPAQMRTLIENVRLEYFPWLVTAGFAGMRSEEIAPAPESKKSPLQWEDFKWSDGVIIVREETAKTGDEREVPILPNLAELLAPYGKSKGPLIADMSQPSKRETARLGKLIGGWQHNCLRDSFCSYRTRITQNIHQTSLEMGNSPTMVKRSYHKRQSIGEAREYFGIAPVKDSKVVSFATA